MKRFFGVLILMAAMVGIAPSAKAWGCTTPGYQRVDVGSKLPSYANGAGDGPSQYYKGSDAPNPTDYYLCEPKGWTPPTDPKAGSQSQNQTQNQSQSSTNTNTLKNRVTATGGNATSSSSATGGSVSNSGNSSNENLNSSTSSASNNGNGANNSTYQSSSTYTEVKQNPGAYAPEIFSANPCAGVGVSAGVGTAPIAGSFGLQKIDKGCDDRATAILFLQAGNELAYAKVMCITPAAKRAHLTLDECKAIVHRQTTVVIPAPAPAPAAPSINITNVIPTPVAVAPEPKPVITVTATQERKFPNCSVPNGSSLTNVCKAELRDAARALVGNPDAVLHIAAPQAVVSEVKAFLKKNGVQHGVEWGVFDDQNNNLTLRLTWTEEVR